MAHLFNNPTELELISTVLLLHFIRDEVTETNTIFIHAHTQYACRRADNVVCYASSFVEAEQ